MRIVSIQTSFNMINQIDQIPITSGSSEHVDDTILESSTYRIILKNLINDMNTVPTNVKTLPRRHLGTT